MEILPASAPQAIARAVEVLANQEVLLYPTDTVYGLGADATSVEAVQQVRTLKGLPTSHPLLVVMADIAMMEEYVDLSPTTHLLVERCLPGPLSLILPTHKGSGVVVERQGTIGVRVPDHPFCLELAKAFGRPYTSTSANKHGTPPRDSVLDILQALSPDAHMIGVAVEGGVARNSLPSTILDCSNGEARLVREGALSRSTLETLIPLVL